MLEEGMLAVRGRRADVAKGPYSGPPAAEALVAISRAIFFAVRRVERRPSTPTLALVPERRAES